MKLRIVKSLVKRVHEALEAPSVTEGQVNNKHAAFCLKLTVLLRRVAEHESKRVALLSVGLLVGRKA